MVYLMIFGYAVIAAFLGLETRDLLKRFKPEWRQCFGSYTVYLRDRKTGRLVMCSRNPFTLLLVKEVR